MLKVFRNATIYTMDHEQTVLKNADLWVENNSIIKVGTNTEVPSNAVVEDITGKIITPGLIDIHTHVGIWGEVSDQIGDGNEVSTPFTPNMLAIDGINKDHFSFNQAREGGVTTVQTGAGSGNPIGGIWCVLKTGGNTLKDMTLVEKSGLKGALGENPKGAFGQRKQKKPYTRMAVAEIIRSGFLKAVRLSDSEREQAIQSQTEVTPFIEVLEGKMPLRLHCHRADDIATAIRIGNEFGIKLCLEHVTEGHLMLEAIKESGANVTLGPFMTSLLKYEVRNLTPKAPKLFHDAGIPFAIMTDHPFTPINYFVLCAAEAVKYGLDGMVALQSITSEAAKIVGIYDKVGSIEVNKDADFVVWSHHPFDSRSNVHATYIDGVKWYYNSNLE